MIDSFKEILLTWRKGPGSRRYVVGSIKPNGSFKYELRGVEDAKKEGFTGYPGLSINSDFQDSNLFSKRIISSERTDTSNLFNFWEIDPIYKDNYLYMLAMTQGKMSNDNFEFLASFRPFKGLSFVTDIAGLSHSEFDINCLSVGDKLTYKLDKNNPVDNEAVLILKDNQKVGYIKKGHHKVFHMQKSENLILTVKAISNGELYVRVNYQ